jgi:ABC-2 type transport system permease protein
VSIWRAAAIARRDLVATFVSPFGIGCTAAFAALSGVLLVVELRAGEARLDQWFAALFVALGLLAALLSTRAFADEERTGSLELLLTAPTSAWHVVIGKLAGLGGVVVAVVVATLACPWLVTQMGDPDPGPILTGYAGMLLLGLAFVAVGIAVSASTANPLVSAAGSAGILAALWLCGVLAGGLHGVAQQVLRYISPASHVTGFMRGTLGAVDVTYFVSLTLVAVASARWTIRARR